MITGFNTDIEYEGVTYHVQTEDKGKSKPIILSLVYNKGTILASKRSPYDDLLKGNFNERVLAERLNKQHRLICAAIQAGRIEDLKKMTAKEADPEKKATPVKPAPAKSKPPAEHVQAKPASPVEKAAPSKKSAKTSVEQILPIPEPPKADSGLPRPPSESLLDFQGIEQPIPKPIFDSEEKLDDTGLIDEPIIEPVAVIEDLDEVVLPAEAVAIVSEPGFPERPDHNKLCIEILGDVHFKGGERNSVGFMVSRGTSRKVVSGAEIMVKILGSSFRPVIFHAVTDINGVATVNMQMPSFKTGRAAFLVRAISDGEEIELRRSIAHG